MSPVPFQLASRMSRMTVSAVREILKVAERPDVLSFAGGLPAPELFPVEEIAQAHARVLRDDGQAALQYSTSEGFRPLREWICERLQKKGIPAQVDQLLITSGAQQGIDLAAKVLLDAGSSVALENPSYLAALQTFSGFEASLLCVPSDDQGMQVDALAKILETQRPRVIYVVPNFHNPKGTTLSLERRHALVALAAQHGIPILEDDPYGEIRFEGEHLPPLAALDGGEGVIHLGTFSKTLTPGLRLGWLHAPKQLMKGITIAKQSTDLHSGSLSQRATAELLRSFPYDAHLDKIRDVYRGRARAMKGALTQHLPVGTTWTNPEGGLFLWTRLPGALDTQPLLAKALEEKVAFVPGSPFYAEHPQREYMRLNFSNRSEALIDEGMKRLGRVVRTALEAGKATRKTG